MTDPAHVKNRVLAVIYIFRSLPAYYFEDIQISTREKNSMKFIINNLMQGRFVKKKPSLRKRIQFLLLTKKGHNFVTKHLFQNALKPFYEYRTDRTARFADTDHKFMNFVFIWHWIENNAQILHTGIRIYEDSNRNACRLKFIYGGNAIILYPDVLILMPDEKRGKEFFKALIIENDTGTETSGTLFRKIVEYAAYAAKGLHHGFIAEAAIVFVFHSKTRSLHVLSNIAKQAQNYNSTMKVKDIRAVQLLEAFTEKGISLRFSLLDTGMRTKESTYIDLAYNLRKELLVVNPSWTYLL